MSAPSGPPHKDSPKKTLQALTTRIIDDLWHVIAHQTNSPSSQHCSLRPVGNPDMGFAWQVSTSVDTLNNDQLTELARLLSTTVFGVKAMARNFEQIDQSENVDRIGKALVKFGFQMKNGVLYFNDASQCPGVKGIPQTVFASMTGSGKTEDDPVCVMMRLAGYGDNEVTLERGLMGDFLIVAQGSLREVHENPVVTSVINSFIGREQDRLAREAAIAAVRQCWGYGSKVGSTVVSDLYTNPGRHKEAEALLRTMRASTIAARGESLCYGGKALPDHRSLNEGTYHLSHGMTRDAQARARAMFRPAQY